MDITKIVGYSLAALGLIFLGISYYLLYYKSNNEITGGPDGGEEVPVTTKDNEQAA
ncbi:MAG: hypothetical protein ACRDFB_05465 [Rhabdochlamydiaceae bacterium]